MNAVRKWWVGAALWALGGALFAACSATGNGSSDDDASGAGGTTATTSAGATGAGEPFQDADVPGDGSADGSNCGAQTEPIELISLGDPPDMLIVMDRSGTMLLPPGMFPVGDSKWQIMKDSLAIVLPARDSNIRFGLTVFPTDNACAVEPGARVGIEINNALPILSYLNTTGPDGNTPAQFALVEALAYYQSIPVNPAGRYVLFATDGIPNCGGDPPNVDIVSDAETVAAAEALADAGIHTFVLGFGGMFGLDPDVLNDAAEAGLEPKPNGPPYFYHAEDAAGLQDALDSIAGGIITPSCSFELASAPPVPDDVAVYFDGAPVPRDANHQNGWDYYPDATTITFFGSYCDSITTGAVTAVDFVYGCPGPIVN